MPFKSGADHHNYMHGIFAKGEGAYTYRSWRAMRVRCYDSSHENFKYYGGRGICVCDRWHVFVNFYEDMGARPKDTTLDRINPDGNYEPSNCRWATSKEQALNRRSTTLIEFNGENVVLSDLASRYGIPQTTIYRRYKQGIRDDALVETANRNKYRTGEKAPLHKLTFNDVLAIKSLLGCGAKVGELAKKFSVSQPTISDIKAGRTWSHCFAGDDSEVVGV